MRLANNDRGSSIDSSSEPSVSSSSLRRWRWVSSGVLSWTIWIGPGLTAAGSPADKLPAPSGPERWTPEVSAATEEGRYVEAIAALGPVCTALERHDDSARRLASCLDDLGMLHLEQGQQALAQHFLERGLSTRRARLGAAHPDVATSLNHLALLNNTRGKYREEQPLLEQALAIDEHALGPRHPNVARDLHNLAVMHKALANVDEAMALFERALSIREDSLGPHHLDVSTTLLNWGELYSDQRLHDAARPLIERAVSIRESALGPEHPKLATALQSLGLVHMELGSLDEAKRLLTRSLAIREQTLGPEHHLVAVALNTLGWTLLALGDHEGVEQMFERALDIQQRALGPQHIHLSRSLQNLGAIYASRGQFERAEERILRALAIDQAHFGSDHPGVIGSINTLASMYRSWGKRDRAAELLQRALSIGEEAWGPEHPSIAVVLNNLGYVLAEQGRHAGAERSLRRAVAIWTDARGPGHNHVALGLNNLGRLYVTMGRHDEALALHRRALRIQDENLARTLVVADDSLRLKYASKSIRWTHYSVSLHMQGAFEDRATAELAATTVIRRKGQVQDLAAQSNAALRRAVPPQEQHLFGRLDAARARYSSLVHDGTRQLTSRQLEEQLAEIDAEQQHVWDELARYTPIARSVASPVTIEDVQRVLPLDGALIEVVRYRPSFSGSWRLSWGSEPPRYAAYLVFPDRLDWIDLGPAAPIESDSDRLRRSLAARRDDVVTHSQALYRRLFEPMSARLGSARRLFIAPDGILNLIPMGALYDGQRHLVERYRIHYVTSGRELVRSTESDSIPAQRAVAVANPAGSNLKGTEAEAEFLASLFSEVKTFRGAEATETRVLGHERPWLLHFGTHGFYGSGAESRNVYGVTDRRTRSAGMLGARGMVQITNPMLYSGLILADAGRDAEGARASDGRLTAYEVSGWDLRGTQLVTLSACDSGLGDVRAGEGVMGMRRAFALAGARTQVMSLWKIDDEATSQLMEAFYRRLARGEQRSDALRDAQLQMLRSAEYSHPYYWAAFVASGDWGPLDLPTDSAPPEPPARGCRASVHAASDDGRLPCSLVLVLVVLPALNRGRARARRPRSGE